MTYPMKLYINIKILSIEIVINQLSGHEKVTCDTCFVTQSD